MIHESTIPDVKVIEPKRFADSRGFFSETWNQRTFSSLVGDVTFVQDNHSLSVDTGTIRGLHYQSPPHAQDKLVRVARGRILDVAVDIRVGSPTFGQWVAEELSAENGRQLFIPKGFLHGFVTLEPNTEILYKCSDYYAPECDGAVRFDDPDIGIDWGIAADKAVLSVKDAEAPLLQDFVSPFTYEAL